MSCLVSGNNTQNKNNDIQNLHPLSQDKVDFLTVILL